MAGQYIKVLFVTIITICSLTLNGCLYSPNPYYNASLHTPGSTWKSSDPDIWFTVNKEGVKSGEFNYNDRIIKIEIGTGGTIVSIGVKDAEGDEELERIINEEGGILISTSILSCSRTKLELKVTYSNLPDFNEKQIVFTRSQ